MRGPRSSTLWHVHRSNPTHEMKTCLQFRHCQIIIGCQMRRSSANFMLIRPFSSVASSNASHEPSTHAKSFVNWFPGHMCAARYHSFIELTFSNVLGPRQNVSWRSACGMLTSFWRSGTLARRYRAGAHRSTIS
jgi:hypothetical protein